MSFAICALSWALLVGLVVRRRLRAAWSFPFYLLVTAVSGLLIVTAPDVFWNWHFWAATDVLQRCLQAALALEIAMKVFRPPLWAGRRRVRLLLGLILAATLCATLLAPVPAGGAFGITLLMERVSYGVAWMFAAFLVAVRYYGVPLDPLHRDLACGFALLMMLLAFNDGLKSVDRFFDLGAAVVAKTLYPCLLAAWNVSAWRPQAPEELSPHALRVLQPWRVP